jgi:hypothetical protein
MSAKQNLAFDYFIPEFVGGLVLFAGIPPTAVGGSLQVQPTQNDQFES